MLPGIGVLLAILRLLRSIQLLVELLVERIELFQIHEVFGWLFLWLRNQSASRCAIRVELRRQEKRKQGKRADQLSGFPPAGKKSVWSHGTILDEFPSRRGTAALFAVIWL